MIKSLIRVTLQQIPDDVVAAKALVHQQEKFLAIVRISLDGY